MKDSGIGIEKLTNVFDEGVRADTGAATEFSTGLGLTFCKRIVEVHGGQIWLTRRSMSVLHSISHYRSTAISREDRPSLCSAGGA